MDITIAQLRYWREECEWSYRDIHEHTGIPITTIATRCQKLNLYPKNKIIARDRWRNRPGPVKHKDIDPKFIEFLYWKCEMSSAEIGVILNIHKRSLITLMKHHSIPRRSHSEAQKIAARKRSKESFVTVTYEEARENGIKSGVVRRQRRKDEIIESSNEAA